MIRYYLHKLLIFGLSMAIAVALVLLSFNILAVGLFHSDGFIANGLKRNSSAIIETIDTELENGAERLSVPKEMLVGAINNDNIDIVISEVAHNFVYGYATAFSNSTEIYGAISSAVSNYSNENGMHLSDDEINRISSYAVDCVNEAVGSYDTANVSIFGFVRGRMMMIAVSVCAVVIIASIVALDFLNRGRHRKFNYIGMGITTAGAVMVACFAVIYKMGFLLKYRFCSFDAYNVAIQLCFINLFKIFFALGLVYFAAGFIMLVVNYNYFRRKKQAHLASRLTEDDTLTDYMDDYYERTTSKHKPGEEFEKDVKKIDFDK